MSYSKTTNFTAKDSLPTGNAAKLIKGVDFDTEFDAIQAASVASDAAIAAHLADTVDAHDASAISSVPAGNLAATTVQAAIDELDSEKAKVAGDFSQTFAVATASGDTHAVPKLQMTTADAATLTSAQSYADSLVVGLWDDRGAYDASVNTFPAGGGSGTAGAIKKGDIWLISVAGTLGGVAVGVGDTVRALADTPGQTASNWALQETNFGYTPENLSNKVTSISGASTNDQYPSAKLVYDQLALKQAITTNLTTWAGIAPATGVAAALIVAIGTAGALVVNGGVLGTPSSGTLTNCTGLPAGGLIATATDKLFGRSTAGAGAGEEITCTAFARSILDDANEATFKATVNLEIGTDVQAYDATLTSIAALGTAADKIAYTTGVDTWAETALTAAARTVLDDATVADMVNTLGGASSSGTGGLARLTSASFVTPILGTPTSGDLRNCSLAVAPAIGGTTPNTGAFTTLNASALATLNGGISTTTITSNALVSTSGYMRVTGSVLVDVASALQFGTNGTNGYAYVNGPNASTYGTYSVVLTRSDGSLPLSPISVSSTGLSVTGTISGTSLNLAGTVTAGGTTGAQTINKATGTVNFAAAAASLVVTNSLVTANSIINCTVGTNDATMKAAQAVAGAGSFTIYPDVNPTAETRVNFCITNLT